MSRYYKSTKHALNGKTMTHIAKLKILPGRVAEWSHREVRTSQKTRELPVIIALPILLQYLLVPGNLNLM